MDRLIAETAERIFADHVDKALLDAAEGGDFPDDLWRVLQDAGLHLAGRPDSGSDLADLFGLLKVAGRHAVPLPLAEVLLANAVLPDEPGEAGFTTIAFDGIAPWARAASGVLDLDGNLYIAFDVEPGANIVGEPRDRVRSREHRSVAVPETLYEYLALSRAALMAGALERTMAMAIDYATERQQFGRPIAKFQAIQHNLAVLAGEVAAAVRACDGAIESLGRPGAFGFTHEHNLHHFTRRLLAWRDEYGAEREWQERLGCSAAAAGADGLWDFITRAH